MTKPTLPSDDGYLDQSRQLVYVPVPAPQAEPQDEIDLRELFTLLWKRKLRIVLVAVIFAIIGVVYALLAPERWSATAVVSAPNYSQLVQINSSLMQLQGVMGSNVAQDLNIFQPKSIFRNFINQFGAYDNKSEFFAEHKYWQAANQQARNGSDKMAERALMDQFLSKVVATAYKDSNFYQLTVPGSSDHTSYEALVGYIKFIQSKSSQVLSKQLVSVIAAQYAGLEQQTTQLINKLQASLTEEQQKTLMALKIAKAAGIRNPSDANTAADTNAGPDALLGDQAQQVSLGTKALQAKLALLQQIKDPSALSPELAGLKSEAAALAKLQKQASDIQITPFDYQQQPQLPLYRDAPKRSLIVVLALLLGLILGVMSVLIQHFLASPAPGKE
ncbi:LPS O-antigen chain length determinant protein WzzB [Dongshaea marina]|uniref:LPS O-antigen chain length determinant protein WzzB n=1 Tax=Dongshaea marina TaxID=2047966 RepID=UPI000D3E6E9A|nr:Wzz/FepE/Etk N-terminal domain-containing protein [Dongshaea marina]